MSSEKRKLPEACMYKQRDMFTEHLSMLPDHPKLQP